ncbi:fatty acyl-CoA reductase wat-like [Pectinophora gossypiella]|uniref:fatty acyl-CoA reductase wat-like n=1 Tax=Pectinophora gossypiella TaxID=13191 RepID=UPI00214ECE0E|nr:fatty acyl-CoA reductase wat-like [Pectinophora gossypiella]
MDPALAKEVATLAQHRVINETIARGDSEIQQFYSGATLFITGGSGFLGKHLIEKLFRSCDIKKVYLLLRPKRKWTFPERLTFILKDPVFDLIKKTKPDFANRIYPVEGDVAEPKLGLSDEEYKLIIEDTDVIIHVAATVSFDEPLKVAALTNVRGTMEMLRLAKKCNNLKSMVHVSTAYSNCTVDRINKEVEEQFYAPPLSPKIMVEMAETMSEQRLNEITPQLIKNWPNTYTFTKAIAEDAVRQMQAEIPICIVRPAIVICSYREPSPGWLDISCAQGPSGLVIGCGLGVLHAIMVQPEIKTDLVPVDLVNNTVIAAGWKTAKQTDRQANIYTVSSFRNHIYMKSIVNTMINEVLPKYASPKAVWYSFTNQTTCRYYYLMLMWLWHYIPAYFIDLGLSIVGKRPSAVKLYTKAAKLMDVLFYFTTNEWKQCDRNLQALAAGMSPVDRTIYDLEISKIDWVEMMTIWAIGIRKYIVKDGLQGTQEGIDKQKRYRIIHYLFSIVYFFILWKILSWSFSLSSTALSYVF